VAALFCFGAVALTLTPTQGKIKRRPSLAGVSKVKQR